MNDDNDFALSAPVFDRAPCAFFDINRPTIAFQNRNARHLSAQSLEISAFHFLSSSHLHFHKDKTAKLGFPPPVSVSRHFRKRPPPKAKTAARKGADDNRSTV
jgi:hypothetical protein